jgi:hypothetical protein
MSKRVFHVIEGGGPLPDGVEALIASIPLPVLFDLPAAHRFAARAERDALFSAEQVTAAVAILARDKTELTTLIAAAGSDQAAETHATIERALAGANALGAILRAAEARLTIAIGAAACGADHSR